MRFIIIAVSVVAILLAAALALLGPGVRFGWWDYGTAFGWMRSYLAMPTLAAAGLAALAFLVALWKARGLAVLALVATLAAGAAGYAPIKMRALATSNPFIHDITTDFENPPPIVAAADAERKNPADYVGHEEMVRDTEMTVAEAQREAFADIEPYLSAASMDEVAEASRAAIRAMGMEIIADGATVDGGRRIEAVYTSFWYGFKDDFIVRLASTDGGGVRVDVRSKSRVGLSDLGANAKRVREFMKRLRASV